MKDSILLTKSMAFSVRMVKLHFYLRKEKKEFVISKQCLRSGTAIGASIREAQYAQSNPDFIHKLSIALKEANETVYWLELLMNTGLIKLFAFDSIQKDVIELKRLLTSSVISAKRKGRG